jgi:bacillolysin
VSDALHASSRSRLPATLGLAIALLLTPSTQVTGQAPQVRVSTASGTSVAAAAARVDELLRTGRLEISRVQDDTLVRRRTHERLQQMYRGVPVFGGELVRQRDGRAIVSVYGRTYEGIDLDVTPAVSRDDAVAAAVRAAGAGSIIETVQLVILPGAAAYALAYRIDLRSPLDLATCFVNAMNVRVERLDSRIRQQGGVIGVGTGVLGDQKKISTTSVTSGYQTVDRLRPDILSTFDFRGSLFRLNLFLIIDTTFDADLAQDSDNHWIDGAIVDAHVYQGWVYDYYFKRFGRRGLDDHNLPIRGIVHPLAREDAAFYSPQTRSVFINNALYLGNGVMVYGDGDGHLFDYLAGGLDIVAHELTHGVTDFTSNLQNRDEPGALNEAFSDIMAATAEFMFQPAGTGRGQSDWLIGEDVTRQAPGYVRSMADPHAAGDPDHYSLRKFVGTSTDSGGVHFNATIVDHVYYLAVNGGRNRVSGITVPGIGLANVDRMAAVFYRAFAFFLVPSSTFADARAATLRAAEELYGTRSNEFVQLKLAWQAAGLN